jgi:uncharacterized protein
VIAVDTNILVYAHREDALFHLPASRRLSELAQGRSAWAIPWPCLHEFLAVVTHSRIYKPASTIVEAIDQIDAWLDSPSLVLLAEADWHWFELRKLLTASHVTGGRVHDARIAALCLQHGVHQLWSADRDFGRFPDLGVVNPLIN